MLNLESRCVVTSAFLSPIQIRLAQEIQSTLFRSQSTDGVALKKMAKQKFGNARSCPITQFNVCVSTLTQRILQIHRIQSINQSTRIWLGQTSWLHTPKALNRTGQMDAEYSSSD